MDLDLAFLGSESVFSQRSDPEPVSFRYHCEPTFEKKYLALKKVRIYLKDRTRITISMVWIWFFSKFGSESVFSQGSDPEPINHTYGMMVFLRHFREKITGVLMIFIILKEKLGRE